jgi:hypothetical protein
MSFYDLTKYGNTDGKNIMKCISMKHIRYVNYNITMFSIQLTMDNGNVFMLKMPDNNTFYEQLRLFNIVNL